MFRFLFATAVLVAITVPSDGWAQLPDESAMIAAGQRVFEGRGLCASCHGKDGEGVLGPTLRLNASKDGWLHTNGSRHAIVTLIKNGLDASATKSGIAMPPRGGARLTDVQVEQVTAYVLTLHAKKPTPK